MWDEGGGPVVGERRLGRVIKENLEDKLSDAILDGELGPAETAVVDVDDDGIVVKTKSPFTVAST